jgi:Zn-dependent protease
MMELAEFVAERLLWMIPLILSITVHEWAHAASAAWLGDDTARLLGRNTLNPVAHVDPVGTLLLPLLGVPFGWAKPVPINPVRFRRGTSMKLGVLIVAIAGPVSNVVLAAICWLIRSAPLIRPGTGLADGLTTMIMLNMGLAVFNMLPIPPLDGSRIVDALMPTRLRPLWHQFSNYGFMLLIVLFLLPMLLMGVNLVQLLFNAIS